MDWKEAEAAIQSYFQAQVVASYNVTPELLAKTTISVLDSDDSFNDSASALATFANSKQIIVSGFTETSANALHTVTAVTAAKITTTSTLTTELAGDTVSIKTALPVLYDNEKTLTQPNEKIWVRFTVETGEDFTSAIGAQKTARIVGMAVAQIYGIAGAGKGVVLDLADDIRTAFRYADDSSIVYALPYKTPVGRVDNWIRVNVNIPFYTDDVS